MERERVLTELNDTKKIITNPNPNQNNETSL